MRLGQQDTLGRDIAAGYLPQFLLDLGGVGDALCSGDDASGGRNLFAQRGFLDGGQGDIGRYHQMHGLKLVALGVGLGLQGLDLTALAAPDVGRPGG